MNKDDPRFKEIPIIPTKEEIEMGKWILDARPNIQGTPCLRHHTYFFPDKDPDYSLWTRIRWRIEGLIHRLSTRVNKDE